MKVKDEAQWQQQCADFARDPSPSAEAFRKFLVYWAEAAELDFAATGFSPMQSLNSTLREAEGATGGRWTLNYIGMALVLLSTHWVPAQDAKHFMEGMTSVEQNLFIDTLAAYKDEMQRAAAEVPSGQTS